MTDWSDGGHAVQSQDLCIPWPEKHKASKGDPGDLCLESHMNDDNIKIQSASSNQDGLRNYSFYREKKVWHF